MKRCFCLLFILALLSCACSRGSGKECSQGACIDFDIAGPIQAGKPAPFTVSIVTDQDLADLGIAVNGGPTVQIEKIESLPESAEITYQNENNIEWKMDTKENTVYTITGTLILDRPTVSYGYFSYMVTATLIHPTIGRVTKPIGITIDANGNQVEGGTEQTEFPLPTAPENLIYITETPIPTTAPSVPPVPTLEYSSAQQEITRLMQTNDGCSTDCFWMRESIRYRLELRAITS